MFHMNLFSRWMIALSLIIALLATNLSYVSISAADNGSEKVDYWKFEGVSDGSYELVSEPDVHQGKYALQLEFNADGEPNKYYFAKQSIPVEADTDYSISLWAKGESVGKAWFGGGPGWVLRSNLAGTYDWKEFSVNYKTGSNQTSFEFLILVEGKTTNLWVDEVRMVKQGTDSNLIRNGNFEGKSVILSANPPSGEVKTGTKLSLSAEDQEATIYYTTDGSNPNDSATVKTYDQPIMVDKAVQIKTYARTSDGGEIEPVAFNYTIAAEEEGEQLLDYKSYIAVAGKGRKVPIFKTAPLEVDGSWDKWDSFTGILLPSDREQQVKISDWKGPEDLSAEAKFAYDDDALYIAVKVEDDIHYGVADSEMWLGDSLQIAFTSDTELYGPEYGFNVLKDGREQIWRWSDGDATLPKEAVDYHVSRSGTTTFYEAKLPWKSILADVPDSKVSMTLLINDNEGNGRKGWIEWTGAIGRGKNPKDMAELLLLQEDEQWTVVLNGPTELAAGFNQQYDLAIPNFGEDTITLAVTSEILGLQNYEVVIPGGKVWKKELPLTMREQGSYTLAVSAQQIAGQLVKQDQIKISVFTNPQDLSAQFEQLRTKLPALATLLTTAEADGLAVDYERINYTVIDQFIAYGLEDIQQNYYER
ncbi:MAG TPA: sugar-binding protein, partial [Paenibacillus sp.]